MVFQPSENEEDDEENLFFKVYEIEENQFTLCVLGRP
jgi:hypothetical protein